MHSNTSIAFAVLIACLGIMSLLGKARLFGPLAVAGFVLGAISAASLFVLLGGIGAAI
ncbi:hypothetical protein [Actinokineospora sp.]|uniref:hypothetical protein n=1 Tax=Actinokineospora sp. TaxID=1872133 RepID=UPI004037E7CF